MKLASISVGVGIMAVPERAAQVKKLLNILELSSELVSWDMRHSGHVANWWRAIAIAQARNPSHVLILEDDAEPCRDFLLAVQRFAELHPDRIISFYSPDPLRANQADGISLIPHQGLSDVAVLYPTRWLEELREDFEVREAELRNMHWQAGFGADELRMKLRPLAKPWVTSPSLVQHGGSPSVLGHRLARTIAPSFIGHAKSALTLDWSKV